jgi:hypothetical protein
MPSSSLLRSCVLLSTLAAALTVAGCSADGSTDDPEGTTAEDLKNADGTANHGGHGNGHGHGDDDDQGDHGHGHEGGGIHAGPHKGGHGAGQHHPGGHMGRPGPEHVDAPAGVYFANITANGTGCPDGTWDVGISDDGQTFTLAFSAYEAQVAEGQAMDRKDCELVIALGSTGGLSYSVASFYYQGYILLDQGMDARQTASYFFDRGDNEHDQSRNDVGGPFDDSYLFQDDIPAGRQVWSPCDRAANLHVRTGIIMRNNPQNTGEGYINDSTVDGSLSIKWALNWRRCN